MSPSSRNESGGTLSHPLRKAPIGLNPAAIDAPQSSGRRYRELDAHGEAEVRIVGRTPEMECVRAAIDDVADTNADVLIIGETGTGKELVARALHQRSAPRGRHFVAINRAAPRVWNPHRVVHDKNNRKSKSK